MAYSTPAEIAQDFKSLSIPTSGGLIIESQVTQFITESDALIDSYVGQRYTVPVSAGAGLQLLKLFSRSLTAERVKLMLEVKQQLSKDANQNVKTVLMSYKDVLAELKKIADGDLALAGATPFVANGGFYSRNYSEQECPLFKKDEKQW